MTTPIRIGLADDDSLARQALANILSRHDDFEIAWTVADGRQAVDALGEDGSGTHVVLLDIHMPVLDGLAACRTITERHPGLPVLMLTTLDPAARLKDAAAAGASGFLCKDEAIDSLPDAIRAAVRGHAIYSASARRLVSDTLAGASDSTGPRPPDRRPATPSPLTGQETRIVGLLAEALSNKQIAKHLAISETTVKTHVSAIITKLGCHDRVGVVTWAFRNGVL